MKSPMIAILLILVGFVVSACGPTPTSTDPAAVVQAYFDARNAGDLDRAMALVADDGVFIVGPVIYRGSFHTGKANIRELNQGEEDRNTRFEWSNLLVDGNVVDGSLYVTTDISRGWAHFEAVVQGGKIVALHRFEGKVLERI